MLIRLLIKQNTLLLRDNILFTNEIKTLKNDIQSLIELNEFITTKVNHIVDNLTSLHKHPSATPHHSSSSSATIPISVFNTKPLSHLSSPFVPTNLHEQCPISSDPYDIIPPPCPH